MSATAQSCRGSSTRTCTWAPSIAPAFGTARIARFEITPQLQSFYALFHAQICFEMGFTTMRDAGRGTPRGDFAEEMCAVRDAINNGIIAGPRLLILAECVITGAHLELLTLPRAMRRPEGMTADGPWELRKKVRELIRSGADGIKTSITGGVSLGTDARGAQYDARRSSTRSLTRRMRSRSRWPCTALHPKACICA